MINPPKSKMKRRVSVENSDFNGEEINEKSERRKVSLHLLVKLLLENTISTL